MLVLLTSFAIAPLRERIGVPIALLILLALVAVGVYACIHPRRHINAYMKRGGEMWQEWNEVNVQIAGVVFACVSGWIFYELARSVWREWFK